MFFIYNVHICIKKFKILCTYTDSLWISTKQSSEQESQLTLLHLLRPFKSSQHLLTLRLVAWYEKMLIVSSKLKTASAWHFRSKSWSWLIEWLPIFRKGSVQSTSHVPSSPQPLKINSEVMSWLVIIPSHKKQRSRKMKLLLQNCILRLILYLCACVYLCRWIYAGIQVFVSCLMCNWEWTHVLWKSRKCSKPRSHLSSSLDQACVSS